MKLRPIRPQPNVRIDDLKTQLKECRELEATFFTARKERRWQDAHRARLNISGYVTPGVYRLGNSERHFVTYGVILVPKKPLFVVPLISIKELRRSIDVDNMEPLGPWHQLPLSDTAGFLDPIVQDGFHGRRYTLVGELVHC